ncbi:MAG: hypothetical protein AMJ81_09585 [Phycisphaerae bacterium SM23_33]|nr:MAG: hypothetical protein AMJ81_09585 [Phycisphaerae bacterium SM23_33]
MAAGGLGLMLFLSPTPAIGWVFGCLFALGFGALAFLFAKPIWIFLSAAIGAHVAVACTAVIIARGRLLRLMLGPHGHWLILSLVLAAVALAAAGIIAQVKLSRRMRLTLAAEGRPRTRTSPARKKDSPEKTR